MIAKIPEIGEIAPGFTMPAENGTSISLGKLLEVGTNILMVFYRGHW